MGTNERRERERLELRQKILDAARELFVTEGYEAVSMRKIADRIEYSATALYSHFADKAALLQALCDNDFAALANEFVTIAAEPDALVRLRKSGEAYVRFAIAHPHQYQLMFMTPLPQTDPTTSACERGNPSSDAYAFLLYIVNELAAEKFFRPELREPELIAQTLWASLHGVAALYVIRKQDDPWITMQDSDLLAAATMESVVRGLARDPDAASKRAPASKRVKPKSPRKGS